jgi:GntR family transcriptional regulator/MocR family aminotransferase
VLDVLAGRGARRVGLEDPGYMLNPAAVRRAGLEVVAVPAGADGIDTTALRRLDPDAVVVTPSHTHPLGGVLAPERRAELLAWARERDRLIVEDDYDAEFRYDRDPVGALQGLAPDRVILAAIRSRAHASSATSRAGSCSATRTRPSASCERPSRCWRPRFSSHAPDPFDPG